MTWHTTPEARAILADCADNLAIDLLNSQIARIDAALSFMRLRRADYLPSIYNMLEGQLKRHRAKAEWYLSLPGGPGETGLGMMGKNGRGPWLDLLIERVDVFANQGRRAAA